MAPLTNSRNWGQIGLTLGLDFARNIMMPVHIQIFEWPFQLVLQLSRSKRWTPTAALNVGTVSPPFATY